LRSIEKRASGGEAVELKLAERRANAQFRIAVGSPVRE
jgi:hypothetical protein